MISAYFWAWIGMSELLLGSQNFREAAEILESVLALRPGYAPVHKDLGRAYYAAGRFSKARQALERAGHYEPGDAGPWDEAYARYLKISAAAAGM